MTENSSRLQRLARRHSPLGPESDATLFHDTDGVWLTLTTGEHLLDLSSGGYRPLGWNHPLLLELPGPTVGTDNDPVWPEMVELAALLAEISPGATNRRVLLCQSGREALARAIELARAQTGRDKTIWLAEVDDIKNCRVADAAAIVAHPLDSRLPGLREVTSQAGVWLIVDESSLAPGTTGRMLAVEHAGIRPDLHVLGPGLAAGLPIGACVTDRSTRHWNNRPAGPSRAACIAALRYLQLLKNGLIEHAAAIGTAIQSAIARGDEPSPGCWFGIGACWNVRLPGPARLHHRIQAECRREKLWLCIRSSSLLLRPPLTLTTAEITSTVETIDRIIRSVYTEK